MANTFNANVRPLLIFRRAAFLVCAIAPSVAHAADSTGLGISKITATRDTIILQGKHDGSNTRIVEVRAHGDYNARNSLGTLTVPASPSTFMVRLPRFDGTRDRLFSNFTAFRENTGEALTAPGKARFVEQFDGVARFTNAFPVAASKKGLQVQMVEDALALGIQHAALNINFSQMLDLAARTNGLTWIVDDATVHFNRSYIESLDRQIKPLAQAGVVISLILLAYESGDPAVNRLLLHPGYDKSSPNHLGAFNTVTAEGVRHFRACIEFLAHRYASDPACGGRVANFILGNEVNSHWFWANMGRVSMESFAEDYLRTARIANTALRTVSTSARLYLSLEHHWNIRYPGGNAEQAFAARPFLEYFNRRAKEQGDFDWHVAFHPYPENLFEPRTWNDKSATTNDNTARITFKNLELLPRFLRRPEMQHEGRARKIILSEQGFHSPDRPEGELWQAAGYAYAWFKCVNLAEIDAFILHRHVDHGAEGGLNLGLWTRNKQGRSHAEPAKKKLSYEFFKDADSPRWRETFAPALPVIGIERWESLLPAR